jgi:hypothetical protein
MAVMKQYNWLISDFEVGGMGREYKRKNKFGYMERYHWLTGEEFAAVAEENNCYWSWAVYSAFNSHISRTDVLEYDSPCADGNPNLWKNPVSIQHPLAEIEIVAWDGAYKLFLCKDDVIADIFMKTFPACENLEIYNRRLNGEIDDSEALEEWYRKKGV